mgnify:FL=1
MQIGIISGWNSRLFIIAGFFMLLNTVMLWARLYSNYELSLLWAAIPAIIALSSGVIGLLWLYPLASIQAPGFAKSGVGFAVLACVALGIAAIWIFAVSVFGDGLSEQRSQWFLILIAIFMIAMVLAFLSNAVAFLQKSEVRIVGYLLLLPLSMWGLMLIVAVFKGMEVAISLDFYTNAVIGGAFLALGITLKKREFASI